MSEKNNPFEELVDDNKGGEEIEAIEIQEEISPEVEKTEESFIPEKEDDTKDVLKDEKKKNFPKKKLLIAGIAIAILSVIGVISYVVYGAYEDAMKEVAAQHTVSPVKTPYKDKTDTDSVGEEGKDNSNYLASVYGTPKEKKSVSVSSSADVVQNTPSLKTEPINYENVPTEDSYQEEDEVLSGAEDELYGVGAKTFKKEGGICILSAKFPIDREYIYYVYDGSKYIPANREKSWDNQGYKFNSPRIVAESFDKRNKFVEVKEGKFLPSEMFRECRAL